MDGLVKGLLGLVAHQFFYLLALLEKQQRWNLMECVFAA
jgi:hypothetical protein